MTLKEYLQWHIQYELGQLEAAKTRLVQQDEYSDEANDVDSDKDTQYTRRSIHCYELIYKEILQKIDQYEVNPKFNGGEHS